MIVEVVMYGDNEEPIAIALVEANSFDEAHAKAMKIMKKQYPDIEPQKYNQTLTDKIYFRSSTD